MKIVFFGTPEFAAKHLEMLLDVGVSVVAVVTKPDRPQGRSLKVQPTPVKMISQNRVPHVPIFQPEKCSSPEFVEILKGFQADLYVVVAYGEIIKQTVLDLPRLGCINVHASLLPYYRGAAPIQRVLMNGEPETGITIIQLVLKMDAGDMISREKLPITPNMTFPELEDVLCQLGCTSLLKVIRDFEQGRVTRVPQDHTLATFAEKILPEECLIDWVKPAKQIHNLIRAVTPSPGAWCYTMVRGQKKRLKVLRSFYEPDVKGVAGTLIQKSKDSLIVACGQGGVVLQEIQLEGKQAMSVADLLKGIPAHEISLLCS
ncbi:MAG: Methionyl-tRNA formyltransferase [Chlamydiia bacterium]|nr:Methionyl-tRNA formyltransferase [Chlamydiia bacterium]